jgi:hypothetical protein
VVYKAADPDALASAIGDLAARNWPRGNGRVTTMRDHFEQLFAHYRALIAAHKA